MTAAIPTTLGNVDLGGQSMDGSKEPKTRIEFILKQLGPYRDTYAQLAKGQRSWLQFFQKPTELGSADVVMKRVQNNLSYFQANYAMIVLLLLLFYLVRAPTTLAVFAVLGAMWVWFVAKNEDVTWRPVVNGVELSKQQRYWIMLGISAILFIYFALDIAFSVIGVGVLVVGIHAVLNPGPSAHDILASTNDEENQAVLDQI